jgi:hypothetical protein
MADPPVPWDRRMSGAAGPVAASGAFSATGGTVKGTDASRMERWGRPGGAGYQIVVRMGRGAVFSQFRRDASV